MIDTLRKRRSAGGGPILPDGSIDGPDRRQISFVYRFGSEGTAGAIRQILQGGFAMPEQLGLTQRIAFDSAVSVEIVEAVAGYAHLLLNASALKFTGTGTLQFTDGDDEAIGPAFSVSADAGLPLSYSPIGHFRSTNGIKVALTGGVVVAGFIQVQKVSLRVN